MSSYRSGLVVSACVAILIASGVVGIPVASRLEAREFGQMGETFPIAEQDLLLVIETKLNQMQASGKFAALQQDMQQQAVHRVRRPTPVGGVSPASEKREWLFDPSTVVEEDIKDTKGNVIAVRGQRVNPLAFVKLQQDLVFVDGEDKAQVEWAVSRWTALNGKIIFVSGSPFDLMKPYQRRFYFDQQGQLVERFGIRHTPAVVSSAGEMLKVVELPLKPGRPGA